MRSHASPRLTQSDHTLELLDEQGAVAGAQDGSRWISIEVSGVAAMRLLLQSVRGPLAPPPSLAERPAHGGGGGGGGELLLLACGELPVWPEASRRPIASRGGIKRCRCRVWVFSSCVCWPTTSPGAVARGRHKGLQQLQTAVSTCSFEGRCQPEPLRASARSSSSASPPPSAPPSTRT